MKVPFYENEAFLKLRKEWGKKLSKAGFVDIESDRGVLRIDRCDRQDRIKLADPRNWADYHTLCARWLYVKVWPSRLRKRQWELHAEGVGHRRATVRCWPMHGNHKSRNQALLYRDADEMMGYVDTEVMMSETQLREDAPPPSVWAEAMQAEGFDPEGYLVPSEGTVQRFDGYGGRSR